VNSNAHRLPGSRMLRGLLLALVVLTPGCCTYFLWDWATDPRYRYSPATRIEGVEPVAGGIEIRVRMADGSEWEGHVAAVDSGDPMAGYAPDGPARPRFAGERRWWLELRGVEWNGRGAFGIPNDPAEVPVEIVRVAPPEPRAVLLPVRPVAVERLHPGTYVVACLCTPLAVSADIVASPFELFFAWIVSGLGRL
jgi:hypothetical protein